jgi:hypothetical protein
MSDQQGGPPASGEPPFPQAPYGGGLPPTPPPSPVIYGGPPAPPQVPAIDRVYSAWQRRVETDYIFNFWTALGWSLLTFGIYGFYVFYQLVRRMRDHNIRRLELFDASIAFAWDQAGKRGLQGELTPSFERAAAHLAVMRQMTLDFRDPAIWLLLSIVTSGIAQIVAFVLLDKDIVRHDQAEVGVEYELSLIFGRFGYQVPGPDVARVKAPDNYAGRIVALIFSFGIYGLWWIYNQMDVPNRHFQANWSQEDALAGAVQALR